MHILTILTNREIKSMKEFGKYVLATIVGTIATTVIVVVLGLMSVVGIVASSESTKSVDDNSVLTLNLNGVISETSSNDIIGQLTGGEANQMGLNDILSAIKKAKDNDKIKGIYIEAGVMQAGLASLLEIRNALEDFKTSKKWIIAYGDAYTQGSYYLASLADKIYLNPDGELDLHGIAAQTMYVKDLYAKVGIKYQIIKVGKYKSATEMYSEDHMSDANREQTTAMVTGIWNNICTSISKSRGISVDSLNSYADRVTAMMSPEDLKSMKLVDGLLYHDEIKAEVKKMLKIDEDEAISQLSVADMRNVKESKKKGDEIAVYYAEGTIVDSPLQGIMNMGEGQIVGKDMSKDLEDLMNDDDVKAVVIRVNSPGGSAYASEQIWHQITKLKERKPVVVSMGDYAASGGYYISCNASWIVAQPTTLTGSIGIFGVVPEASELLKDKLSLHFDGVTTNRHADMAQTVYGFLLRPFDAEELQLLQGYINRGYAQFRKRVADGRKQSTESIENVAQGHVWLGKDALGIKLVDQLGGLDDAVKKAAQLAKVESYYTEEYPAEKDWKEKLLSMNEASENYLNEKIKTELGDWYLPFVYMKNIQNQCPVQAALPYTLKIY